MLWCVRDHNGGLMGFQGEDGNILALFTTCYLADMWILDAHLEQHLAHALYNDLEIIEVFEVASPEYTYYVVDPPANPGAEIDGGIIAEILKLKESA